MKKENLNSNITINYKPYNPIIYYYSIFSSPFLFHARLKNFENNISITRLHQSGKKIYPFIRIILAHESIHESIFKKKNRGAVSKQLTIKLILKLNRNLPSSRIAQTSTS